MKTYTTSILCVALWLLASANLWARKTIEGKVLFPEGVGAVGVNLFLQKELNGTTTDAEGNFKLISNQKGDNLIVNYLGYETDTIAISTLGREVAIILREDALKMNEVEITERRISLQKSRITTLQTEKITYDELCRAACCNLSESFATNASVDVSYSDAATGAKQIRLLGLPGTYVQMLTENVPNFRGAASLFGMDYIPAPWMESIQVSKGSASVRNGYESLTGQINVEYKKPPTADPLTINIFASDAGRIEGNVDGAIKINPYLSTGILAHYSRDKMVHDKNGDNFLDQPLLEQANIMNRWYYKKGNYISQAGVKFIYETRDNGQIAHHSSTTQIHNPYLIGINTMRGEIFTKNGYVLNPDKNMSVALILSGSYHNQAARYGLLQYDLQQSNLYANLLFDTEFTIRHKLSTGLSLNMDRTVQKSAYFTQTNPLNAFRPERNEVVGGAFAEYTWLALRTLTIQAGVRGDYHNEYGFFVTPRLHLKYDPIEQIQIRASAGQGYRSVNVFVENNFLFASNRIKNIAVADNLAMETAFNWGGSITGQIPVGNREITVSAEYYETNFQQQVVADVMSNPNGISFYNLDGKSYARNAQIEVSYPFFTGFDLRAAFRWTDTKTTYNGVLMEKPLVNRYKGLLTASYKTAKSGWQFDTTAQFNGGGTMPTVGVDSNGTPLWASTFDPYTIWGAQVTKWFKKWSVYLGAENILNFTQESPIIGSQNPWGDTFDATMVWGPVHGRKIYGGVRWNL